MKRKWIKTYEALFRFSLIKLLNPVYAMIHNDDDVIDIKNALTNALDDYREYLTDLVSSKNNKETQISEDIMRIEKELDPVITTELNLAFFLRTTSNILNMQVTKTELSIEQKFEDYYNTLDERIERCLDIIENDGEHEHEDDEDDDVSVLGRHEYTEELQKLQAELNKMSEWVSKTGAKVAILFEGRDGAGKGSSIKKFVQYLNPKYFKVVTMGIPSKEEMVGQNWFKRYESKMPKAGEIVFFDRSYYGQATVNPTMGYCSDEQYKYFMDHVNQFEQKLIEDDKIKLFKFWFSITKEKQLQRFELRKKSPLKYWKYSPNDEKSLDKWDIFTNYKEQCFIKTSTAIAPWVIFQSGDKRLSQLNSIRYVLDKIDYEGKNKEDIGHLYPDVIYEIK